MRAPHTPHRSFCGIIRKSPRRAFSLVEVLVGTCVLLFILFPAFAIIAQSSKSVASSRMQTQGSAALQTLVEDFRAMKFSDIKANYHTGRTQPVDLTALIPTEGLDGSRYYAALNLSQPDSRADFLFAAFTLTWVDGFGHVQSRTYHTRFSQNGLSDQILHGF